MRSESMLKHFLTVGHLLKKISFQVGKWTVLWTGNRESSGVLVLFNVTQYLYGSK